MQTSSKTILTEAADHLEGQRDRLIKERDDHDEQANRARKGIADIDRRLADIRKDLAS